MKILYFGGGLGNQIFEYTFYLAIREHFPEEDIRGIYLNSKFMEHEGGLELENVFNVKLPPTSLKAKLLTGLIYLWKKIHPKTNLCSLHNTIVNWDAIIFNAFKSDISFYENRINWLEFKPIKLSNKNLEIINRMQSTNSVCLHIRRGDFLSIEYMNILANIATVKYYERAIEFVQSKLINTFFFVFSDDIAWCKENMQLSQVTYIDWNIGKDSYIDMYLMTFAKANIIANSTFSYWGSYLNRNNPIVIYPKKWINADYYPNIFPINWIGLTSE